MTPATDHPAGSAAQPPVVAARALVKRFPGQLALDRVDFDVIGGEIHGLVGENGSGKSTLIKTLAGYHHADGGEILIDGERVEGLSPARAYELGLRFIHQDPQIFTSLTIAENLAVGTRFQRSRGMSVRWGAERRAAREALAALGLDLDPGLPMMRLAPAQRTMVAVARALQPARDGSTARVLVMDEPTAALPEHEVESLFAVVRRVAAQGVGVIYVSHRLEEIFSLTDRVTVLRDGRLIATRQTSELDEPALVRLIVGQTFKAALERSAGPPPQTAPRLEVEGLVAHRLKGVSLAVHAGEVVGLGGLLGSGRSELARIVFGVQTPSAGEIRVDGEPLALRGPRDAIAAGIALVPEDRRGQSAFGTMTVRENISMADLRPFTRAGSLSGGPERREVARLMEQFDVRPRQSEKAFALLSGGNQQKAVLARWMRLAPKVMILDEPTQGIDVNAKAEIFELVRRLSEQGVATILISSDFAELEHICHRVVVLRNGAVAGELTGERITTDQITDLAFLDAQIA